MKKEVLIVVALFLIFLPSVNSDDCLPEWECTDWSPCSGNFQIRTCLDIKSCENDSSKPEERQPCGIQCETNWECGEWTPEKCPDSKIQTRDCQDLNSCNTFENKPIEARNCDKDFSWVFGFIIAILIAFILGAILLIREKIKRNTASKPL